MGIVAILSPLVAERIAAGEVIERPASIVKEAVENALDAGATEVAVILENGGKDLIEIIDNGQGMDRGDLELSVKRHATSKLRAVEDLDRVATLGFRGEALPSIAAVAELTIVSRARGSDDAYELKARPEGECHSEKITFGHFLGSPHGTRLRAAGLFSQIPARLKFLKSQASEVSQVREWIERLALTRPYVGFRLVSDDRTLTHLRAAPADLPIEEAEVRRVRAILGDGEDFPVATHSIEAGPIRVRAHWLQGLSSPQTRKLVQIVNGRAVRDRLLQQALLSPFRQSLLPGQFPAVALRVDINPDQIDVNVHPAKTEIRFLDSGKVFRAVESTIEGLVSKHGAPAVAAQSGAGEPADLPWGGFASPRTQATLGGYSIGHSDGFASGSPGGATSWLAAEPAQPLAAWEFKGPASHPLSDGVYAGAIFQTYLLYDLGSELALVDQHAAHERIRYEQLKKSVMSGEVPGAQSLLLPEAVHFPAENRSVLEERLPWLETLGFEAELFGESALLFRAVPLAWGTDELRIRLKGLVERLISLEEQPSALDEILFEKLASEACHSAIRAGDRLQPEQARALVEQLFECEHPWNCPHGRPTVARVPRARFEEWFQRRV